MRTREPAVVLQFRPRSVTVAEPLPRPLSFLELLFSFFVSYPPRCSPVAVRCSPSTRCRRRVSGRRRSRE